MKSNGIRVIGLIVFIAQSLSIIAQNQAALEVSYRTTSPSLRKEGVVVTNQYILQISDKGSKFYSPRTQALDSLESTPEGKKVYQQMALNSYLGGKLKDMPKRDGSYYVTKNFEKGELEHFDVIGKEKYRYSEPIEQMTWIVTDSTKRVLGYECLQGVADYNGRHWTVWFTTELPVQQGPWKLHGLPGLILDASADGGDYRFEATGLQQTSKELTPVYLKDEYMTVDRKQYLREKRSFADNPLAKLNAQMGGAIVKVTHADGSEVTKVATSNADFLETDYR